MMLQSYFYRFFIFSLTILTFCACKNGVSIEKKTSTSKTAAEILGNPEYLAMSYGGYREKTREVQPTLPELKEDLKLLAAMGVKILRTYNLQLDQAPNILKAIQELKEADPNFEMYVMLGAWIDCENAWTAEPNHERENKVTNSIEIQKAVTLANAHPDIVKIIAVGNEAMVHWASSYFVHPRVILKWVTHLQDLKKENKLPEHLWITSSDNFASWGGGDDTYHNEDLVALIKAVDYLSVHTYPFHDTHYNPIFWKQKRTTATGLSELEHIENAMSRAHDYAISQYTSVKTYVESLGIEKPIHIGETGWASISNGFYGENGSKATDELKQALYFKAIRAWSNKNKISCFYFEAFDEQWKDANNPNGSENHFGLFTIDGKAKYALWNQVEKGIFDGLTRNGNPITKTYSGNMEKLLDDVLVPPMMNNTDTN